MKKLIITIMLLGAISLMGQTNLSLGDVAFTGYQSESGDKFAFVLLTDIDSGTEITFTDQGWLSSGGFFQDEEENTIYWMSSNSMNYGTQIVIQTTDDDKLEASHGGVGGDTFGLSSDGDQIFAYQGDRPILGNEENFLAAIQMNGEWNSDATSTKKSAKPSIFTDGVNSLFIEALDGSEYDNAVYNCSIKSSDATTLRNAINNETNWIKSDDFDANPIPIPYCVEPLPVELVTFSSNVKGNKVELNWETATEVNNYGFEIEKQNSVLNGQNMEWENIGFVNGHGNSNSNKYYSYEDKTVVSGKYSYRLKQIDIDGQYEYSNVINVDLKLPNKVKLSQNYPNPFNPSTTINYSIPIDSYVTLGIYDILGNKVANLENGYISAGNYSFSFDASNLTSGIYFYIIKVGNFIETKQMLLMK